MATLKQIRDKADAKLVEFWDALLIRQVAYHYKHNNYFQLVVISPVIDGGDTTMVVTHPHDEAYEADIAFNFYSPIPFQIRVDTWGGVFDKGFKATVVVELLDGRKFTRSRSLTDTRVYAQDRENTAEALPVGEHYYRGSEPIISTTPWSEVIEETI